MESPGQRRWRAHFAIAELAAYEYTIEGWIDRFATWRQELSKKAAAGQDVSSELLEGAALVRAAHGRTRAAARRQVLADAVATLEDTSRPSRTRLSVALSPELAQHMAAVADRSRATRYERVLSVFVERERARFGAWYEMFPRSAGSDPTRSATFARGGGTAAVRIGDGLRRPLSPADPSDRPELPQGTQQFDEPVPDDPGSPWAIGAAEGGHTAVEPGLGTLADFDRFVDAAMRNNLEIALDIAFQARPITPGSPRIPSGSGTGPTARSSTPRTRRRSTRTSTRSTSSPTSGTRSGTSSCT